MKEQDIQNSICEFLALQDDLFYTRQGNAPTPIRTKTGIRFRKKSCHEKKGISDIIIVMLTRAGSYTIFMEVKAEKGALSQDQKLFRSEVKKFGAYYTVVRSVGQAKAYIEKVRMNAHAEL